MMMDDGTRKSSQKTAENGVGEEIIGSGLNETIILVTGGSGMVGQALRTVVERNEENHSNERWIFLSSKDADLRDFDQTKAAFEKYRPTHVIHLAALVGGLYHNLSRNLDFFRDNFLMNDNVLYNAHLVGVKKVVSCLSTCIFPDNVSYPLDESMIHNGRPHPSSFGYSFGKRSLDIMNNCYKSQFGYDWVSVIPCNLYGLHDNFNLKNGHCIPGLIHKTFLAKKQRTPLTVCGTGQALRQFTFAEDFARLCIWALRHYTDIQPIITSVGEEEEVSIKDLVSMIAKALDFTGEIVYDPSKPDGQLKKTASNQKLRELLPDFEFTPLLDGIQETCDWFVENYENCRK